MTMTTCVRAALALATFPLVAGAQVRFERTGYRLTSIGEKVIAAARVSGARQAGIRWRISDPTVATVDAKGVVESRRIGRTRLWAVAGDDSASALILVDQWTAKYDFSPAIVRLYAVGAQAPVRIIARDAAGFPINDPGRRVTGCRSLNERIATLTPAGVVTAHANGVTFIRCTDRGVADSVRIEVRQRAASVTIVDKLGLTSRAAGDTFRIRVAAKDVSGQDIREAQATWASLNPAILNVDPLSGFVRAVTPGTARVVAQVGDVTDTVSVQVVPGSGMAPVMLAADTLGYAPMLGEPMVPSLHLQPLFLTIGDTARVTPRDGTGSAIENAEFRMTSNDTSLVRTLSGQRVVARRIGNTHVVVQFGGIRDSLLVSVRERADPEAIAAEETANAVVFVRPTFNLDSAQARNRAQLDSASRAIQRQSVVAVYSGRMVGIFALVMHAAHATRDTNFLDRRTGMLYGGTAEVAPHRRIRLTASYRTGQLSPTGSGEELTVTEAEGDITVQPAPWFGLRAGYVRRVTSTPLATQRWEFPRASAVTRFSFVGGAITTVTGLSLLPGAKYTGYLDAQQNPIDPDPFSFAGEAGLELHSGSFTTALSYYAERFTFPEVNNNATSRTDQFSALRLRIGFQLGR